MFSSTVLLLALLVAVVAYVVQTARLRAAHRANAASVKLRLSTRAIRTVERNGGIDAYLLATPDSRLPEPALAVKRRLRKAQAKRQAAATPG